MNQMRVLCGVMALGLVACSKAKPPICREDSVGRCTAYSGSAYESTEAKAAIETRCGAAGGTYLSSGECSDAKQVGRCTRNEGKAFEQGDRHYETSSKTATQLEADCVAEGALWRN